MRVVDRPDGIEFRGNGFKIPREEIRILEKGFRFSRAEIEIAAASITRQVQQTETFVLADESTQKMLLAVAHFSDERGIASGWDAATGTAKGISVAQLALKAGVPIRQAHTVLDALCRDADGLCRDQKRPLYRFRTTSQTGLVWFLPDYEDDEGIF